MWWLLVLWLTDWWYLFSFPSRYGFRLLRLVIESSWNKFSSILLIDILNGLLRWFMLLLLLISCFWYWLGCPIWDNWELLIWYWVPSSWLLLPFRFHQLEDCLEIIENWLFLIEIIVCLNCLLWVLLILRDRDVLASICMLQELSVLRTPMLVFRILILVLRNLILLKFGRLT